MKKKVVKEMYGRPKIAPLMYDKITFSELSSTFKEFNQRKLNNYFEDDCFTGIKNNYGKNELRESLWNTDGGFRYGLIEFFNSEFISIYLYIPYEYDEFYMPEDLIGPYKELVSKEKFDEICQKLAKIDAVFELKMYPVGKKEFIFFFTITYCIAKLTDGLIIMDNVWFGDLKDDIVIKQVYDVDMLEELLIHWVFSPPSSSKHPTKNNFFTNVKQQIALYLKEKMGF
ncbi:hypothetical protein [Flectobacillus roseus]|uniref:Uncharacterized protein n=1 Tax=Flectobacillus roseus TaxID=502259 RepID=A0ABT6Y8Y1_9BACT|nr:hypothetical protein [Flectobacillus roseus]MDI9860027.1 hypothetical protein [Flectobacillus roseus]